MNTPASDISSLLDQLRKQLLEVVRERNELRVERTQLKDALQRIANYPSNYQPGNHISYGNAVRKEHERMIEIAREALSDPKGPSA